MHRDHWREQADAIHRTIVKKWEPYSEEDQRFLTVALAGEVGEFTNLVKKIWRGDFYHPADNYHVRAERIPEELADIAVYLEILARAFGVDLNEACVRKIPELLRRWPEAEEAVAALVQPAAKPQTPDCPSCGRKPEDWPPEGCHERLRCDPIDYSSAVEGRG